MKKKLLFIYHSMIIGGSTTALLSLLNNLDPEEFEIDLQLFRNEGPLLDVIPEHVNLLPEAERYKGSKSRLVKLCKFFLKGYVFRFLWKRSCRGNTKAVLAGFQSKELSRKNKKCYDYAIGFLEGWSDWYLAFGTRANKKYGWLHSTYANITSEPDSELPWMEQVDKIVFVTDSCREAFNEILPKLAEKAITIENITDSSIIRKRSMQTDETDLDYQNFVESDRFKIVTVCRLTVSVKGLDRIVNAAMELKARGYTFLWYIIGDGEDKAKLNDMIQKADVSDCVVSIGKRMNPYPFMAAADIMCMPSRYEGKPIVVTESMILGVPPIVTEYLSAHEQITTEVDGLILENQDGSLTAGVARCLHDKKLLNTVRKHLHTNEYGNTGYLSEIEKLLFS